MQQGDLACELNGMSWTDDNALEKEDVSAVPSSKEKGRSWRDLSTLNFYERNKKYA